MKHVMKRIFLLFFFFLPLLLSAAPAPVEEGDGNEAVVEKEAAANEESKKFDWHLNLRGRVSLATENRDFLFKCDYLRVQLTGTFAKHFFFRFRQRFNKAITDGNYLSATDYLYLSWRKNDWEILGGKTYVACGGFEYQATSYDIYIRPAFFSGLSGMYNYALNGARHFKNETLWLQVSNSLYSNRASNLLGYSILLQGRQGVWQHSWSVNAFERAKGHYNFYVCLGNRFHIGEIAFVDLGLVHRLDLDRPTFFKDFSAVTKFKVRATEWMRIFGKATWDYKQSGIEDPMLPDGTDSWQAGCGLEFFPVPHSEMVRLHLVYFNRDGALNCVLAGVGLNLDLR